MKTAASSLLKRSTLYGGPQRAAHYNHPYLGPLTDHLSRQAFKARKGIVDRPLQAQSSQPSEAEVMAIYEQRYQVRAQRSLNFTHGPYHID